jgi:hypothetical protein
MNTIAAQMLILMQTLFPLCCPLYSLGKIMAQVVLKELKQHVIVKSVQFVFSLEQQDTY